MLTLVFTLESFNFVIREQEVQVITGLFSWPLQEDSNGTKGFADRAHVPARAQRHIPARAQKEEGDHLKGEDGASTKDLQEWLRQHPTYTMDVPGYIPVSVRSTWWD